MKNRAGQYINNLTGEFTYKFFKPAMLPLDFELNVTDEILSLLIKANKEIAVLDGLVSRIPNINLFISMYVRKEALLSSQIEGTQATLDDILDPTIDANSNKDVAEVINYIKAIEFAINKLDDLPLCNRLIKQVHRVLLKGSRGQEKSPGEFRTSQNWIGGIGSTLNTDRFIPPSPSEMIEAMSNLEKYLNYEDKLDILIRASLIHYQFETIHPFLDGNGRIGRLLITLFLKDKGVLKAPALYISYFLKRNRVEYYDRMMEVRNKGNYEQWIEFFLKAVYDSAKDAIENIDKLILLHDRNIKIINSCGRSKITLLKVFDYLEANPIIEISKTCKALSLSYNTVAKAVNALIEKSILIKSNSQNRNRIFAYEDYLKILRKGT